MMEGIMMELDEAIRHCEEVANSKEIETDYVGYSITDVNFSKIVNGSPLTNNLLMKKEREECKECAESGGMKMTLDEAIKHCRKVAWQNENAAVMYKQKKEASRFLEKALAEKAEMDCLQCAAEHRQLAKWLRELKDLKENHKED